MMYQVPLEALHHGDGDDNWQKIIGVFSFSYISKESRELVFKHVGYIVTKAIMFCLILLLDSLVKSPAYKQFISEKLMHFKEISMSKAKCLTFLYNNNKLRKIIKIQYEKDAMIQKIKLMKRQLTIWNKKFFNPDSLLDVRQNTILGYLEKQNQNKTIDSMRKMGTFDFRLDKIEEENKSDLARSNINLAIPENDLDLYSDSRSSFLEVQSPPKDINAVTHEEEEFLLEELKKQHLNWITRLVNYIKRKYSNQMLLISSRKRLRAIESDLKKGMHQVHTTLENTLLLIHYLKNEQGKNRVKALCASMPARFNVDKIKKDDSSTQKLNKFQVSTFLGLIVSNSSILCYIFMIIAHIVNGSLLSLVYPVSIFCYALFEEIRPHKGYWKFILLYTMIVLIAKAFVKSFYISDNIPEGLNLFLKNFRIGLESVDDDNLSTSYYVFEILILLFVVIHIISLMLQGLWDTREIDLEAIDQAAVRVNTNKKSEKKIKKNTKTIIQRTNYQRSLSEELHFAINDSDGNHLSDDEEQKVFDAGRKTFTLKHTQPPQVSDFGDPFKGHFENTIASRWRNFQTPILYDLDLHHYDRDNAPNKMLFVDTARALTEYPYEELAIEEAQKFIDDELRNAGIFQNYLAQTRKKLFRNNYFKRLFPAVSAQKPGRDFYAPMALVQFFMLVYIILFFTFMERDYTDITSQKLQIRQFSALLVLAAFLQIFFMLLDRYIYIAKTFMIKKNVDDSDDEDLLEGTPTK